MKKLFLGALLLANLAALAGSRSKVTTGGAPDKSDAGVSLNDAVGCRVSAFVADGGNIAAMDLKLFYYDPTAAMWGPSELSDCTSAALFSDGGAPPIQGCSYAVFAQEGMLGAQVISATMQDAGTASPQVNVECWGPRIPGGNGAQNQ